MFLILANKMKIVFITSKQFQIVAFLAIFIASAVLFFLARLYLDLKNLLIWGYLGIFATNLFCAATIIFPIPGEAINITAGAALNPFWISIIASVAATIGELTSYYVGCLGRKIIPELYLEKYQNAKSWLKRHGNFAVFLFALLPILIFDLLGIAAGTFRFPLWRFILFCWLGRLLRSLFEACLGHGVFDFIM